MEQLSDPTNPRKRASESVESPWDEESAKRACVESSSSSPHLKLLEDLYDLDAEDDEAEATAPLSPSDKEDLVAEMMKSLEKVIEDASEEPRGEGEPSTASPSHFSPDLDAEWANEEIPHFPESPGHDASFNGELHVGDFEENAKIREMLQVSDDELGVPLSSSSDPDPEETSFHEEWASLANEGSLADNHAWLEASFQPFEEGPLLFREAFEPLLLF